MLLEVEKALELADQEAAAAGRTGVGGRAGQPVDQVAGPAVKRAEVHLEEDQRGGDDSEDHRVDAPVDGDQAQDQHVAKPASPLGDLQPVQGRQVVPFGLGRPGCLDPRVAPNAPGKPPAIGQVDPQA